MPSFSGVVVAVLTPFKADGSLDLDSFKWLLEGLAEAGVQGIWVAGTTGEWTSLKPGEKARLYQAAVEAVGGRLKVFAGVAGLRMDEVLENARAAGDAGVDYVFSTPPLYFKPRREDLLGYYEKIADASGRQVYIYTIPSNVGYNIPVDEVEWIVAELSSIAGIKATLNDYTYISGLIGVKEVRRSFTILSGSEELLLHTLASGGDGSVTALGNLLPGLPVQVWRSWTGKDLEGAAEATRLIVKARRMVEGLGQLPITLKTLLHKLGSPIEARVRPPLGGVVDVTSVARIICRDLRPYLHPRLPCREDETYRIQYL